MAASFDHLAGVFAASFRLKFMFFAGVVQTALRVVLPVITSVVLSAVITGIFPFLLHPRN